MKLSRQVTFLVLAGLALPALSCRSGEDTSKNLASVVGIIVVVGNEPFASLAIRTDDGTTYRIHGAPGVNRLLAANQGRRAKAVGTAVSQTGEGLVLEGASVELLSEQSEPHP